MKFILIFLSFIFAFDIRAQTSEDSGSISVHPSPSIGIAVVDSLAGKNQACYLLLLDENRTMHVVAAPVADNFDKTTFFDVNGKYRIFFYSVEKKCQTTTRRNPAVVSDNHKRMRRLHMAEK